MGGETFCPHDGTKLVDARELSPGELTGSRLDDLVRLDKLAYSDQFAERYTGRLLESRRAVYVTVFNQTFKVDPSATKRVETARAKVGSPMPLQINTLLQTHFDKAVPYLVESEPRGPSVRTLLDEKRTLDWQHAVRITANLARSMQWLHEQGVPHCSFHPTSVFVTNLQRGEIIVGDWALEALFPPDSAERIVEEDPNSFAGYIDYMAPEIARATDKADIRSAVYALGCVLYEMVLGRVPLPGKSPGEVLKRHRHEKPVRLSIAVEGQELPPQLDDIVEMMLAKDPSKRFQSPAAAVAALSNLVDEAPDALAPQLERAGETDVDDLYRTIDMDSVDRDALDAVYEDEDDIAHKPTLMMGSGLVDAAELKTGAVTGESKTVDGGETSPDTALQEETRSTGQYNKPAAIRASTEDATDESITPDDVTRPTQPIAEGTAKKTLAMGAMSAVSKSNNDDDGKKTLLNFGPPAGGEDGPATGPPKKLSRRQKKSLKKNGKTDPDLVPVTAKPTDETIKVNVDAEALERQLAETSTPTSGPPAGAAPPPGTQSDAVPTVEHPAKEEDFHEKPTISLDADTASKAGLKDGKPNIGFITPDKSRDATRDIDRSSWFTGNTEDVWENQLAQEAAEYSERSNKKIIIGIIGILVLGTLALIAYFEFVATPADEEVETDVVATDPEPEAPKINLDEIVAAFDEALSAGRVVQPIGNSALTHLESLKRHGADGPRYEEARTRFVEAARNAAKKADENDDLRGARSLAGYASQFAPEDEELQAMTADFQARFTGVAGEADTAPAPDAGTADAGSPDMGAEDLSEEPEEQPKVAANPKPKPKPKPKPRPKNTPKKWDTGDAASIAREAHSAHQSGNLDQARKLYVKSLEADPKNTTALAGLGKVYFDKADYRSAVKYQTKAVRYAPSRNDYRINLGQSYYRLGKYSEAIAVWEKVLARDPGNNTARQYVELAKRKLGR